MKLHFLLLLISCSTFAQNIIIPDANFKAYLVENAEINTNGDDEIQLSEAENFEGIININYNKSIQDLTGIENFIKLKVLECMDSNLIDLNVDKNIALQELKISHNKKITDLDVSKNLLLKKLICYNLSLTSLDVSKNLNLEFLQCAGNSLTGLDVSKNKNLIHLEFSQNAISSLNLVNNKLLKTLYCDSNNFGILSVTDNEELTYLNCSSNKLEQLDVSKNLNLIGLNCSHNNIEQLDVSNNLKLRSLDCSMNSLNNLDLNFSDKIKFGGSLYCFDNNLKSLNVSQIKYIGEFLCSNSKIIDFNTGNTEFGYIDCSSNDFVNLDFSGNRIDRLICKRNNSLEKINIANGENDKIDSVDLQYSYPYCIQIDEGFVPPTDNSWIKSYTSTYGYGDDCNPLSINENALDKDISLYPNPVISTLNIETKQIINQVSVFNTLGAKVLETNASQLNVSQLQKGLYLVKITTDTGSEVTKRFVKQ